MDGELVPMDDLCQLPPTRLPLFQISMKPTPARSGMRFFSEDPSTTMQVALYNTKSTISKSAVSNKSLLVQYLPCLYIRSVRQYNFYVFARSIFDPHHESFFGLPNYRQCCSLLGFQPTQTMLYIQNTE